MIVVFILHEDKAINRQSRQLSAPAKKEGDGFGGGDGLCGDLSTTVYSVQQRYRKSLVCSSPDFYPMGVWFSRLNPLF